MAQCIKRALQVLHRQGAESTEAFQLLREAYEKLSAYHVPEMWARCLENEAGVLPTEEGEQEEVVKSVKSKRLGLFQSLFDVILRLHELI